MESRPKDLPEAKLKEYASTLAYACTEKGIFEKNYAKDFNAGYDPVSWRLTKGGDISTTENVQRVFDDIEKQQRIINNGDLLKILDLAGREVDKPWVNPGITLTDKLNPYQRSHTSDQAESLKLLKKLYLQTAALILENVTINPDENTKKDIKIMHDHMKDKSSLVNCMVNPLRVESLEKEGGTYKELNMMLTKAGQQEAEVKKGPPRKGSTDNL